MLNNTVIGYYSSCCAQRQAPVLHSSPSTDKRSSGRSKRPPSDGGVVPVDPFSHHVQKVLVKLLDRPSALDAEAHFLIGESYDFSHGHLKIPCRASEHQ